MDINPRKNWTEDFDYENGQYICTCLRCKEEFLGHKGRCLCKECDTQLREKGNEAKSNHN